MVATCCNHSFVQTFTYDVAKCSERSGEFGKGCYVLDAGAETHVG